MIAFVLIWVYAGLMVLLVGLCRLSARADRWVESLFPTTDEEDDVDGIKW